MINENAVQPAISDKSVKSKKKIKFYSKMSLLTLLSLSNTEQSTKTQYFRHLMSTN
jgi:hypothetical protein